MLRQVGFELFEIMSKLQILPEQGEIMFNYNCVRRRRMQT